MITVLILIGVVGTIFGYAFGVLTGYAVAKGEKFVFGRLERKRKLWMARWQEDGFEYGSEDQ